MVPPPVNLYGSAQMFNNNNRKPRTQRFKNPHNIIYIYIIYKNIEHRQTDRETERETERDRERERDTERYTQ